MTGQPRSAAAAPPGRRGSRGRPGRRRSTRGSKRKTGSTRRRTRRTGAGSGVTSASSGIVVGLRVSRVVCAGRGLEEPHVPGQPRRRELVGEPAAVRREARARSIDAAVRQRDSPTERERAGVVELEPRVAVLVRVDDERPDPARSPTHSRSHARLEHRAPLPGRDVVARDRRTCRGPARRAEEGRRVGDPRGAPNTASSSCGATSTRRPATRSTRWSSSSPVRSVSRWTASQRPSGEKPATSQ